MTTTSKVELSASKQVEAYFEYSAGIKEVLANGHRRITDPDDLRWENELMQKPFQGDVTGYVNVAEVTRVDGDVVKSVGICGYTMHMNTAREFLRNFKAAQEAGLPKPWDQESFYRDTQKAAEAARAEGRLQDLENFQRILEATIKGAVNASKPAVA